MVRINKIHPKSHPKPRPKSWGLVVALLVLGAWPVQADEAQDRFRSETEVRLMEMESRFRTVTGQYEEAMYRLTQMNRQLENALSDMEFRLQQIERGQQPVPTMPDLSGEGQIILDGTDQPILLTAVDHANPPVEAVAPPASLKATPETHPEQFLEPGTPEEQFRAAFFLVRRNELDKAILSFRAFITLYPNHIYRANAAYWLGRSYAAQHNHVDAARVLVDAYNKHADSEKGAEILLHLGLSLEQLGQNQEACSAFDELDRRYNDASAAVKEGAIDGRTKAGCS
ncbi:MAG: tol-pal system protein YbgF [Alphaproteobacteria bacterium]|nr:MAG: tol-pal system protein YbgF [Alphaproteobacteria bacterium]